MLFSTFIIALPLVSAHMEMSWPHPINSKYDPANSAANIDYNMISPLLADGSNYPCKGYQNLQPQRSVASYTAGQKYNATIAGGANHRGGSCQLSLSYDNGQTFKVIKSFIGGCPLTSTYDFSIPASAPSGDNVLLSWSWVNLVGNREFYMNCARVTIKGTTADTSTMKQELPDIFLANLGSKSSCTTVEDQEVVYPDPGSDVDYAAGISSSSPRSSNLCRGGPQNSSSSSAQTNTPTTFITATRAATSSRSVSTDSPSATTSISFSTATPANKAAPSSTSGLAPSSSATVAPSNVACAPDTIRCDSSSTWSVCGSNSGFVSMGSVATGTECVSGKIQRVGGTGSCTGVPTIKCSSDGGVFMVCNQGEWLPMGPVAPGTVCRDGSIQSV